jgi:acyl dehydratase
MLLRASQIEVMDDAMVEILRQKTPFERLEIAHGMWRLARGIVLDQLKQQNPNWSSEQINREAARRLSHGAV